MAATVECPHFYQTVMNFKIAAPPESQSQSQLQQSQMQSQSQFYPQPIEITSPSPSSAPSPSFANHSPVSPGLPYAFHSSLTHLSNSSTTSSDSLSADSSVLTRYLSTPDLRTIPNHRRRSSDSAGNPLLISSRQRSRSDLGSGSNCDFTTNPVSAQESSLFRCLWEVSPGQLCSQTYTDPNTFYSHLCEDHVGRKKSNNSSDKCMWVGCSHAAKPFAKRDHFVSHCRAHVAFKGNVCPECKAGFKWPHDLKKHGLKTGHISFPESSSSESSKNRPEPYDSKKRFRHSRSLSREAIDRPTNPTIWGDLSRSSSGSSDGLLTEYNAHPAPAIIVTPTLEICTAQNLMWRSNSSGHTLIQEAANLLHPLPPSSPAISIASIFSDDGFSDNNSIAGDLSDLLPDSLFCSRESSPVSIFDDYQVQEKNLQRAMEYFHIMEPSFLPADSPSVSSNYSIPTPSSFFSDLPDASSPAPLYPSTFSPLNLQPALSSTPIYPSVASPMAGEELSSRGFQGSPSDSNLSPSLLAVTSHSFESTLVGSNVSIEPSPILVTTQPDNFLGLQHKRNDCSNTGNGAFQSVEVSHPLGLTEFEMEFFK